MNKQQLVQRLGKEMEEKGRDMTQAGIEDLLESLADVAEEQLDAGNEVTLPGIGKLHLKHQKARTGRNPQTGESVEIPAKRVVKIKPEKGLREAVE